MTGRLIVSGMGHVAHAECSCGWRVACCRRDVLHDRFGTYRSRWEPKDRAGFALQQHMARKHDIKWDEIKIEEVQSAARGHRATGT